MKSNRRNFIKLSGLSGLGMASSVLSASGNQPELFPSTEKGDKTIKALEPLNRFPRIVQEYFTTTVMQAEQEGNKRRSVLKTKGDAEQYVREVRKKIKECFGPLPEKTPLNASVTGTIERDSHIIEKVVFESRPGFLITANLYIPKEMKFPLPGVIGTCGHSDSGKAYPDYQSFAQGLVLQGYVVLIYDPIGQGERIQYPSDENKSRYGIGVQEHLHAGNQMFLVGESLSSWFVWDGIRALDYLLTRKEVDPNHIGVTGNSGGGTQATWLCGIEPRLTMAAPSCFVTTFLHNMENELPADTEQCPWRALRLGLDHSDFIAAMAPKPVILLGQEKDFFDVRGLEESFKRLKHLYKLLGVEQNIQLHVGAGYHGYSKENREAMYGWFNRITKGTNVNTEPEITVEKDETLWCTPHGQVGTLGSRTIFSFTSELSKSLKKGRNTLRENELKKAVKETLKLPDFVEIPDFRILRPIGERFYPKKYACTYAVESEPDILTLVYRLDDNPGYSRPFHSSERAFLYVSHFSADDELRNDIWLKDLILSQSDYTVFACDVRGVGESRPNTCNADYLVPYGSDYFYAIHSVMLDYPYLGQKTYDLLRLVQWIKSFGHEEIHLVGKGWGTIPSTFAALLSDTVKKITLKNALTRFGSIAETEDYNWPLSTLLPNVLKSFDLPDCYKVLTKKDLRILDFWSAQESNKR